MSTRPKSELKGDYSPTEWAIFDALRRQNGATSSALMVKVYPNEKTRRINANIIVNRAIVTLGLKLERNKETFRLVRTRLPMQRAMENRLVKRGMVGFDQGKAGQGKNRAKAHEEA